MSLKKKALSTDLTAPSILQDLTSRLVRQEDIIESQRFRAFYERTFRGKPKTFLDSEGQIYPNFELGIRLKMLGLNIGVAARSAEVEPYLLIAAYQSPEGQALAAKVRKELDDEFKNLQGQVCEVVRKALHNEDPHVNLAAANLWFKVEKEQKVNLVVTAEDVIQGLLQKRTEIEQDSQGFIDD
jgi:hypothetical protein